MSKLLSIYNDCAFDEVVLPAAANTEYSFLVDAELFRLPENTRVELECVNGRWRFCGPEAGGEIVPQSGKQRGGWLPDCGRFSFVTARGDILTILVEEKDSPLSVFSKYVLVPDKPVSVGRGSDNVIRCLYSGGDNKNSLVSRHHCNILYNGYEAVLEDTSSNGTYVNNIKVSGKRPLSFGDNIRVFGLSLIYLGGILAANSPEGFETDLKAADAEAIEFMAAKGSGQGSSGKSVFRRAPRTVPGINSETISIDPPPPPREAPKVPLFMQIGPAMTMALPMLMGTGLTLAASRMNAGGALMYTGLITAAASALVGSFWAVMNMRFSRKTAAEEEARRMERYGQYLESKRKHIEEIYRADSAALRERYISSDKIAEYDILSEELWNRNLNHSDVLTYRIGLGDVPFPARIELQQERFTMAEDSLAERPGSIREQFSVMHEVPVCVDLKEKSLIGVIGTPGGWAQVIRNIIAQIAGSNSYADVKLAFVYDSARISKAGSWEFVKWLPHIWSEDGKVRCFASNRNEASEVFYSLGQVMRARFEEKDRPEDSGTAACPHYVLIVLNKELLEGELISKYISVTSGEIGLSTIIASEQYKGLPNSCEFIIENSDSFSGVYGTIDENTDRRPVRFDQVSAEKLAAFAKRLANIEADGTETGGEIPASVSFFDMYGISRPDDLDSPQRWRRANTAETMRALIGVKSGSAPCFLDIHERYHGPHGLVAGTTGSGKSETLQTYILSLAVNYSPEDVGFFIIDYKGGGMANLFDGLPHMIGSVSNLSGNQVKRAMVSIRSENKRRQRIFSDYGVNNINAYTSLYKNGDAREPMPHLFIIIDEFAELKREEPEFMRGLVSVAQVGRSLGIHLILATQKPAGTVDENIWSNSKFRVCHQVQDRQDSMDMLRRPDAAYLTQAGRAYLQVGSDEIFEQFQSGYSGAVYDENLGDRKLVVAQMLNSVARVDLAGNHFRIRYQEEARRRWIETLCRAVEQARGGESGGDDLLYSESFLEDIYSYIAHAGMDFKRGQYNDFRLREFIKLCGSVPEGTPEERAGLIIDAAIRRGVKLPETRARTQLEAVIEYLGAVAEEVGCGKQISLWMPVLPEKLLLTEIEGFREPEPFPGRQEGQWTLSAVIGKGDDPENQNQMPISIDFANGGHHAVCGTVSTGRSTLLQTAIYSLINKYSSNELNVYIIDFSSKLLTVFEDAEQVGGTVTDAEEDAEKLSKLFTLISGIMEERKKLLASTSFRDYAEHEAWALPAIVIAIDNYGSFAEKTEDRYGDRVRQIAREGIACGVFLLVSASGFGMSGIPTRLADNFRTSLCLEMPDAYQYGEVMRAVRVPIYPESGVKGRGLVFSGEKIIEFQTALACPGEGISERNGNIRRRIEKLNAANTGRPARRIPVIPRDPSWDRYAAEEDYRRLLESRALLPNGYNAETAACSALDLRELLTYVVSGTKRSGKSTYMKTLMLACADKGFDICVIELGSSEFSPIADRLGCRYVTDGQGVYDFARDVLLAESVARGERKKLCMEQNLEDAEFYDAMSEYKTLCVFIPAARSFVEEIYNSESPACNALGVYETLAGDRGRHYNFHFFLELGDGDAGDVLGRAFIRSCRENGKGIRFGGRFQSQRLFSFDNLSYKQQLAAMKPGLGVVPSEDGSAAVEKLVVPNYRG